MSCVNLHHVNKLVNLPCWKKSNFLKKEFTEILLYPKLLTIGKSNIFRQEYFSNMEITENLLSKHDYYFSESQK